MLVTICHILMEQKDRDSRGVPLFSRRAPNFYEPGVVVPDVPDPAVA